MNEQELRQAWRDHADAPDEVLARVEGWAPCVEVGDVRAWARLLVHVGCEHLRADDRVASAFSAVEARLGPQPPVDVGRAVLAVLAGAPLAADDGAPPADHEADVLATVAPIAAARGLDELLGRAHARVPAVAGRLPSDAPGVRALAMATNNVACALEERPALEPAARDALRTAATLARTLWERAGTWVEVERAEYRLARSHLALGELAAAVTHAEVCLAICQGNQAGPAELVFAWEILAVTCRRVGARRRATEALAWGRALVDAPDFPADLAAYARAALDAAAKA